MPTLQATVSIAFTPIEVPVRSPRRVSVVGVKTSIFGFLTWGSHGLHTASLAWRGWPAVPFA
jgi:hypothetical protein